MSCPQDAGFFIMDFTLDDNETCFFWGLGGLIPFIHYLPVVKNIGILSFHLHWHSRELGVFQVARCPFEPIEPATSMTRSYLPLALRKNTWNLLGPLEKKHVHTITSNLSNYSISIGFNEPTRYTVYLKLLTLINQHMKP